MPDILDDPVKIEKIIKIYKSKDVLPDYCTLHGAFLDVTIFSQDKRIFEVSDCRVEQSIAIARSLGAKAIVFHTNYIPNFRQEAYRKHWVESNARYWSQKLAKYSDIKIYMENMFDEDCELLVQLAERMKDVKNFGICFDYAHAHAFGVEADIDQWCEKLGKYVKHIHINDNDLKNDLHQPVGRGKIDWVNFKKNYEKYFPEATVLVEVNGIDKILTSLEYFDTL